MTDHLQNPRSNASSQPPALHNPTSNGGAPRNPPSSEFPSELSIRAEPPGHTSCNGKYTLSGSTEQGFPVWKNGDMRVYTDPGGFWLIGSAADVSRGVGWFASQKPHKGKAPNDPHQAWAYVVKGKDKSGWVDDAPLVVLSEKEENQPTPTTWKIMVASAGLPSTALQLNLEQFTKAAQKSNGVILKKFLLGSTLKLHFSSVEELFNCVATAGGSSMVTENGVASFVYLRRVYAGIDTRNVGMIGAWDLEKALSKNEVVKQYLRISPELSQSLIRQMDQKGAGWAKLGEFVRWCLAQKKHEKEKREKNKHHDPTSDTRGDPKHRERDNARKSPDPTEAQASHKLLHYLQQRCPTGKVTLHELTSALASDRESQIELGWPSHQSAVLYKLLGGYAKGYVALSDFALFLKVTHLFNAIDTARDGFIQPAEFGSALINSKELQRELGVPPDAANSTFREIDQSKTGFISFKEFYAYFQGRVSKAKPKDASDDKAVAAPRYSHPEDAYSTREKLGEGAYGVVFLVKRRADNLALIMKKPKMHTGIVDMEDVRKEAELLKKVKHPHIIRFIEMFGDRAGALVIITESLITLMLEVDQYRRPTIDTVISNIPAAYKDEEGGCMASYIADRRPKKPEATNLVHPNSMH
eukprot:gene3419-5349_t